MGPKNEIKVLGNGNIVLQGIENSTISINTSDNDDILSKLNQLESIHLAALAQIAKQEKDNWGPLFDKLLTRHLSEKNIVKGDISNTGRDSIVGDNNNNTSNYYNNEKTKQSKELTPNLPTLREDQIVGRKEDLKDLHKRLFDNKQVVLVNGMGGIGKTTLAQVYLTKYYAEYKYIAWVGLNAEGADFEADFIRTEGLLARFNINPQGKTVHDSFLELISALKELDESPCLLIIDNANKDLGTFYNYLPNQPSWHLLVTSREQIPHFEPKELGFLNEENAVKLFRKYYTRQKPDDAFIVELVSDLEYHTLTIEILAKTAQEQRTAPNDLLNAISNNLEVDVDGVRHHGDKIVKLTSYLCSIFKTSKLEENEKWLLQQFICLPAELHAYDLLKELITFEENLKFNLSKTLDSLTKKGWLLCNEDGESYRIHRIIIDVVKVSIGLEEREVELLIETISSKLSMDQTKDNPIDTFQWVPYGKATLLQFETSSSIEISLLQNNLATTLQALADYESAKELLEKAVESDEKNFGEGHATTAIRYSNLAMVLKDLGDYEGAKVLLEKAVESDKKNFGEGHPTAAIRYSNLALVLKDLRDYEGAKELLEKAYKVLKEQLGDKHPTTKKTKGNLDHIISSINK